MITGSYEFLDLRKYCNDYSVQSYQGVLVVCPWCKTRFKIFAQDTYLESSCEKCGGNLYG